jgi:hypothetical protein
MVIDDHDADLGRLRQWPRSYAIPARYGPRLSGGDTPGAHPYPSWDELFSLYRNDAGDTFNDAAAALGIADATRFLSGWGLKFFDYDNDGRLDLFLANGHPDDLADTLRLHVIVLGIGGRTGIDWLEIRWPLPSTSVQRFADLPLNRYVTIVEGKPAWS